MTTISVKHEQLAASLSDKEYREAFVSSSLDFGTAFQIRALREARGWSQSQLADQAGMKQEAISRLEDRNYGKATQSTLKRLAAAFDVAYIGKYAPFSEFIEWVSDLSPERLAPPSYAEEAARDTLQGPVWAPVFEEGSNDIAVSWEARGTSASDAGTPTVHAERKATEYAVA